MCLFSNFVKTNYLYLLIEAFICVYLRISPIVIKSEAINVQILFCHVAYHQPILCIDFPFVYLIIAHVLHELQDINYIKKLLRLFGLYLCFISWWCKSLLRITIVVFKIYILGVLATHYCNKYSKYIYRYIIIKHRIKIYLC